MSIKQQNKVGAKIFRQTDVRAEQPKKYTKSWPTIE